VGAFVTYVTESIPDLFSTVWFVVVTLVQVVGSIEFLFPYQDRISALGYLLPEIRLLLNEVEYCWNEIDCGKLTSGEIAEKIKEFKHSKISIEQKYAGSSFFPRKEKLEDLARRDADIYIEDFSHRSFQ
jgi:hypothetical protein